jgi:outer membrane protein assembly factor BamA
MKHSLAILALFSLTTISNAQDSSNASSTFLDVPDSVLVVGQIILHGNSQTKDFVILREMSLRQGVRITRSLLDYDKNRIYSLGLFNQVQIGVIPAVDSFATLVVDVHERWYIFPYPIFGLKDRDWSKVFYGFGILHNNFLGRNEKLFTSVIFGFDPSIRLTYRNPFLSDDGEYFLAGSIGYSKVRNRSLLAQIGAAGFDERHFSAGVTLGKRFGIAHSLWLSVSYELISASEYQPGRTISQDGTDRFPVVSAGYTFDTRDLIEYAGTGTLARATITKFGIPGNELDFIRYGADVRQYTPVATDVVLQGRVFGDIVAAGPTPSHNRAFFGYGERIRGHFVEVLEGENIFGVSSEAHYMILAPHYFKVGFLPQEFSVWRFGISAALFGDAGIVWFRNQPFALDRFVKGYGAGLHFLLPYSAVVRIEYAWNEVRHGEFILDLGAAF